jgi:hypothetical protein
MTGFRARFPALLLIGAQHETDMSFSRLSLGMGLASRYTKALFGFGRVIDSPVSGFWAGSYLSAYGGLVSPVPMIIIMLFRYSISATPR